MAFTRRFLALAAASALCAAIVPATAQAAAAWPDKPITFITPYPPGGSADIITRFIADRVSKQVGKPIIVENRPAQPRPWVPTMPRVLRPMATRSWSRPWQP
jgi:tripartite-type tricarboxylate transporter receptor subunit TctC